MRASALLLPLIAFGFFPSPGGVRHAPAPRPPAVVADEYLARFEELQALQPDRDQVASVRDLVLDRDVGHFVFQSGTMSLLAPVGDRVVGVVFHGVGTLTFTPPTRLERRRLALREKDGRVDDRFTDAVLLFTDSTMHELEDRLQFGPGPSVGNSGASIRAMLHYLSDDRHDTFEHDFMADVLNGAARGLFYGYVLREGGGSVVEMDNPNIVDGIRLWWASTSGQIEARPEPLTIFNPAGMPADSLDPTGHGAMPYVKAYRIESWMPQSGASLAFSAAAHLELGADQPLGPWVPFSLYWRLDVDSARADDGQLLPAFKGHESAQGWVRLPATLSPGQSLGVTLYYHGPLVTRYYQAYELSQFYGPSPGRWYPGRPDGRDFATFDLTFHYPAWLALASVGDQLDSTTAEQMTTTRWVTPSRTRNASFNIGHFKPYLTAEPGLPALTVLLDEHSTQHVNETAAGQINSALHFYTDHFGPLGLRNLVVSEAPSWSSGSTPGLVVLAASSYHDLDSRGQFALYRAQVVAGQWWVAEVEPATYHDRWLSDALTTFSGLWYAESVLPEAPAGRETLELYRTYLVKRRDEPTPLSLGTRPWSTSRVSPEGIVVAKGVWVLQMLRSLMRDQGTMSDERFGAMLRQFHAEYDGRLVTTADFQRIVEQAAGMPMDWFFREWVENTRIPTYRVATRIEPADGRYKVQLKIGQEDVPGDFMMYVPVAVDLEGGATQHFRVKVSGAQSVIDLPLLATRPVKVRFNEFDGVLARVETTSW